MDVNDRIKAYLRIINSEVHEFRIVEDLTMLMAVNSVSDNEIKDAITSPKGTQRLGYICDVASDFGENAKNNLSPIRKNLQQWRDENYDELNPVYFTTNHDFSNTILSEYSDKWKVISNFSADDLKKYEVENDSHSR